MPLNGELVNVSLMVRDVGTDMQLNISVNGEQIILVHCIEVVHFNERN